MCSRAKFFLCLLLSACAKGDPVADSRPGSGPGVPTGIHDVPPTQPTSSSSSSSTLPTSGEVETSSPVPTASEPYTSGVGSKFDLGAPPVPTGGLETGPFNPTTGPNTTSGDASTSSSTGDMEDSSSTGDRPDPQPNEGLYQSCLSTEECDPVLTDGCFLITNEDMQIEDGYCTILCGDVVDCGEAPMVGGMQVCAMVLDSKICAILCMIDEDCPQGMFCKNLGGGGDNYCI